ncbi:EGF domain-specific O-linked N-acetylglucosamine transferase [Hondaea fermentalgiana]|uniref:EGF domain-specific O-linked N-acetylglucosamine transferase n=1 Tax=Hondaea fermentalgiana TaxID=2315210 RepID=A0A2R5GCK5_9STRA|nr:EGF domain-specific O-linked N-acetylglucosamine transferase [Hondaea fermentalgiana]|eukprot:GBG28069.1 EGF domain-specific O-linked N-acetylglucosamine transferase [Hondaea fermentalgiana]
MRTRGAAYVRPEQYEAKALSSRSSGEGFATANFVRTERKRTIVAALVAAALLVTGFIVVVVVEQTPASQAQRGAAVGVLAAAVERTEGFPGQATLRGSGKDVKHVLMHTAAQSSFVDDKTKVALPWHEVQVEGCNRVFGNGFVPLFNACNSRLVCWQNPLAVAATVCRLRDLHVDNRRITVTPGNEPIETVRWRNESAEMCVYEAGAFSLEQCDSDPLSLASEDKFPFHFLDVMMHLNTTTPETSACRETVTTPTLLVTRYEYANFYHTITDWYNVYQTIHMNELEEVNIVFLDGHSASAFGDEWPKLFRTTPRYVSSLAPETCFKEAYLVAPGYGSSLSHPTMQRWIECPPSPYLKEFIQHIMASIGLQHMLNDKQVIPPRKRPRVLFLLRKIYLAHPRIKRLSRTLANGKEVVETLQRDLPDVDVVPISLETMSFAQQVAVVREADVLLGVHGAGLSHLLFMRPGAMVIELIPDEYEPFHHYDSFATFMGIRHLRVLVPFDIPDEGITMDPQQLVDVLRKERLQPVNKA